MEQAGHRAQMLAGMVEVDDLRPLAKLRGRRFSDPLRAIAHHHHRAEVGNAVALSVPADHG
jgi:hypothetical protein